MSEYKLVSWRWYHAVQKSNRQQCHTHLLTRSHAIEISKNENEQFNIYLYMHYALCIRDENERASERASQRASDSSYA